MNNVVNVHFLYSAWIMTPNTSYGVHFVCCGNQAYYVLLSILSSFYFLSLDHGPVRYVSEPRSMNASCLLWLGGSTVTAHRWQHQCRQRGHVSSKWGPPAGGCNGVGGRWWSVTTHRRWQHQWQGWGVASAIACRRHHWLWLISVGARPILSAVPSSNSESTAILLHFAPSVEYLWSGRQGAN